ncbi:MAG: alpha/beta hydrolase [Clostridia bacterium]|nr:alpha/beta hydrolase [Clostridia bacterium]
MEKIYLWNGRAPYSDVSAGQEQPSLTPFTVNGSKGALIVIPGGAYWIKADHEGAPVAEYFRDAGISAFTLDYRVHPCDKMAPLADANRAVRLVRSFGYEKVAVLGFSAGGNLCCSAAVHYDAGDPDSADPVERFSSRPDGFIPCYAVASLTKYTHIGSLRNLLGNECESVAWQRYFSAEENVTDDTPPAFIWHTASDQSVPVENSLNLASALSAHGVSYEMHIFPAGAHGLGLAQNTEAACEWPRLAAAWLLRGGYGV